MRSLLKSVLSLVACERCVLCGRRLTEGEQHVCAACFFELPRPYWHMSEENPLSQLFYGLFDVVRANAFLEYIPGAQSALLIHALKYNNRPSVGVHLGAVLANEWQQTGFFSDVDLIVPVPLAQKRLQERGYNQSEMIARGIAQVTGIPVETTGVLRTISNPTQTHVASMERLGNVDAIFKVVNAEVFANRHVLLVDDVVTTGATLISLAKEIAKAGNVRFSFAVLGMTKREIR